MQTNTVVAAGNPPPYLKVSRLAQPTDTAVRIKQATIATGTFTVIAGPCSVEDRGLILEIADFLSGLGVKILRGGAFKPRTSPYSFQGLGDKGLEYMREAAQRFGMITITEALGEDLVEPVAEHCDIIQIGSRNSQNFQLLTKAGKTGKPVLLKRGFMNTLEEFMFSAEYVAVTGNSKIILCERGIRTFETATRNTLDISAVALVRQESHLPIIIDPSHAAGRTDIIVPLVKAAMAVGAQGAMIEVHPQPERAISDGKQTLNFRQFAALMQEVKQLATALQMQLL